ncbi:MAG: hypothetical protein PVI75_07050 [Gammaproteobacteria bacterium]|jgi:hypothetical protein
MFGLFGFKKKKKKTKKAKISLFDSMLKCVEDANYKRKDAFKKFKHIKGLSDTPYDDISDSDDINVLLLYFFCCAYTVRVFYRITEEKSEYCTKILHKIITADTAKCRRDDFKKIFNHVKEAHVTIFVTYFYATLHQLIAKFPCKIDYRETNATKLMLVFKLSKDVINLAWFSEIMCNKKEIFDKVYKDNEVENALLRCFPQKDSERQKSNAKNFNDTFFTNKHKSIGLCNLAKRINTYYKLFKNKKKKGLENTFGKKGLESMISNATKYVNELSKKQNNKNVNIVPILSKKQSNKKMKHVMTTEEGILNVLYALACAYETNQKLKESIEQQYVKEPILYTNSIKQEKTTKGNLTKFIEKMKKHQFDDDNIISDLLKENVSSRNEEQNKKQGTQEKQNTNKKNTNKTFGSSQYMY